MELKTNKISLKLHKMGKSVRGLGNFYLWVMFFLNSIGLLMLDLMGFYNEIIFQESMFVITTRSLASMFLWLIFIILLLRTRSRISKAIKECKKQKPLKVLSTIFVLIFLYILGLVFGSFAPTFGLLRIYEVDTIINYLADLRAACIGLSILVIVWGVNLNKFGDEVSKQIGYNKPARKIMGGAKTIVVGAIFLLFHSIVYAIPITRDSLSYGNLNPLFTLVNSIDSYYSIGSFVQIMGIISSISYFLAVFLLSIGFARSGKGIKRGFSRYGFKGTSPSSTGVRSGHLPQSRYSPQYGVSYGQQMGYTQNTSQNPPQQYQQSGHQGNYSNVQASYSQNNPSKSQPPRANMPHSSSSPRLSKAQRMDRMKRLFKISKKVSIDDLANTMQMDRSELFQDLISSPDALEGFQLDGDYLVIQDQSKVEDGVDTFMDSLDDQFNDWGQKETSKEGKVEEFSEEFEY